LPVGLVVMETYTFLLTHTQTLMVKEIPMSLRISSIRIAISDGTSSTLDTLRKIGRQGLMYNSVISPKMSSITIQLITIYLKDYSFSSGMICQPIRLTMVK
jgi:hypothetical protein